MISDQEWFTEYAPTVGSAFSLKIRQKLHEEQTPFQRLEIYETEQYGRLMVLDGFIMLTQRDNFIYHEMMAHPALFSHQNPKKVVIIGGGDCGTLLEVLKHPGVEHALQVEIDERVTRVSEKYFPELCAANNDPRATLLFDDGIAWVENAEPGSVDVIIVDSTDPIGPAEGLFREPFYKACLTALGDNGVLVQQSESPLVHSEKITWPMHKAMSAAGFVDVQTLFFPLIVYPTGWWSATLAGKQAIRYTREKDAIQTQFKTDYYTPDIHKAAFAQPAFFSRKESKK